MAVLPGYDFDPTEEVTANKIFRWLAGSQIDSSNQESLAAHGLTMYELGTGSTAVTLSNEGGLFYNKTTGKWEVNTRWGLTPIFGAGMFTKRCPSFQNGVSDKLRFFSAMTKISHMYGSTRFTVTDPALLEAGWEDIGQALTMRENLTGVNNRSCVLSMTVLWPSLDNHGPSGELTEVSSWTATHRLMCLRGFTPIFCTGITSATNSKASIGGADGMIRFRLVGDTQKQDLTGAYAFLEVADYVQTALPGVSNTHLAYVTPYVGATYGNTYGRINKIV